MKTVKKIFKIIGIIIGILVIALLAYLIYPERYLIYLKAVCVLSYLKSYLNSLEE